MKKLKIVSELRDKYFELNNSEYIVKNMKFVSFYTKEVGNVIFILINTKTFEFIPICSGVDEHMRGMLVFEQYKSLYNFTNDFNSIMFFNTHDFILIHKNYSLDNCLTILKICKNEKSLLQMVLIKTFDGVCSIDMNKIEDIVVDKLVFTNNAILNSKGERFFQLLDFFANSFLNLNNAINFSNLHNKVLVDKYLELKNIVGNIVYTNECFSYEAVLGLNGIKNKIHIMLNDVINNGNFNNFDVLKILFGNINYALERIKSF